MSIEPSICVEGALPERVIIFSDTSWPMGGAEIMALLSATEMAARGLEVIFVAGDTAEKCPLDRNRITVVAMGGKPLLDRPALDAAVDGIYNSRALGFVRDIIAAYDTPATVYHTHNWSQIFSPSLFEALRPVASRLFISAHDFALSCPNLSFSNYQKAGSACELKPLSLDCITTHCDRRAYSHKLWRVARAMQLKRTLDFRRDRPLVGIIHPFMSEWYERGGIPAENIRVVRNPVRPFSQTRIEAENNTDLFFIGRLVYEKGPDIAAEAARLSGRRLRMIGDGEMRPTINRAYPEASVEGWCSHEQIAEKLKSARAVLVSSRLPETFTLVAHEAMRAGLPVIAFSDVDCVEMAALGGAMVVPPREASGLAAAIRQLDDNAAVARISKIAFRESGRFSNTEATWADTLIGYYTELLNRSRDDKPGSASTLSSSSSLTLN